MTIRVVAALICEGDRLLVCQRRADGPLPLKWEFPGGKVEVGEGDVDALRRELREELGIDVQSATELFRTRHVYPGAMEVDLRFFHVKDFAGSVVNRAFLEICWVSVSELKLLDFLEGDLPLIEKLTDGELCL
ncbi:MAG: (deoxy)nucleoside triphosphate pyrophosphohydrolase [Deltaproteobacteria bacterium]|nr:(deoxy)nucleoside triphosphate pyrophosphohydrolase [Deltaproteobacteria bacterium]